MRKYLSRIDFQLLPIIFFLMGISILVISAFSVEVGAEFSDVSFWTPQVKRQLESFLLGGLVFAALVIFDYRKLREFTWVLYVLMLFALIGLFFTDPIQRVQRWYRIPFISLNIQPSEYAKLVVVLALSWFLERRRSQARSWSTAFFSLLIVGVPFVLILKQPDLGTALVLCPIALVMFYFGDIRPVVVRTMAIGGFIALVLVGSIFSGAISHERLRPYATLFLKEYQFDRLDPHTHHQQAAVTAIAVGSWTGSGWGKSDFSGGGFLPAPYTDSVFSAFGEEFGLLGLWGLLFLYYALLRRCFRVAVVAKEPFGQLLAAGLSVYLAMHVLVNIGMMCGLLPITGVPLVLITYGGSSVIATMTAIGILQSVYSRRFMF